MYQAKLNTANIIAGFAGKKKKDFANAIREINNETMILRIPDEEIPELSKFHIYCSDYIMKYGAAMFDHDKFIKDKVYEEWRNGCAYLNLPDIEQLIMSFRIRNNPYVLRRGTSYDGIGGAFVRGEGVEYGFIFEPFKNWLRSRIHREQD